MTVRNVDQHITEGESLVIIGTARDGKTIVSDNTVVDEPWELQYMYIVSFFGGLWVLVRLVNGWQLNRNRWTVEPRETPHITWREGGHD